MIFGEKAYRSLPLMHEEQPSTLRESPVASQLRGFNCVNLMISNNVLYM